AYGDISVACSLEGTVAWMFPVAASYEQATLMSPYATQNCEICRPPAQARLPRPVPDSVTDVPVGPLFGVIPVMATVGPGEISPSASARSAAAVEACSSGPPQAISEATRTNGIRDRVGLRMPAASATAVPAESAP